jgi:hypothetical protein
LKHVVYLAQAAEDDVNASGYRRLDGIR